MDESGSEKRLVNLLSNFGKRVCIVTDEGVCPKQAPVLRPPSGSRGAAAQSRNENAFRIFIPRKYCIAAAIRALPQRGPHTKQAIGL